MYGIDAKIKPNANEVLTRTSAAAAINVGEIKMEFKGHTLVELKRKRVKGFCVECIKKKSDPQYKKNLPKVITYCPSCPGGIWLCEPCFYEKHSNM